MGTGAGNSPLHGVIASLSLELRFLVGRCALVLYKHASCPLSTRNGFLLFAAASAAPNSNNVLKNVPSGDFVIGQVPECSHYEISR